MITIDSLAAFGADVKNGLGRCMNNESFYLKLVNMELNDPNFAKLRQALDCGDAKTAFEAAHALKGSLGNLSLTPIYEPVNELTELVRTAVGIPDGARELAQKAFNKFEELEALA